MTTSLICIPPQSFITIRLEVSFSSMGDFMHLRLFTSGFLATPTARPRKNISVHSVYFSFLLTDELEGRKLPRAPHYLNVVQSE